MLDVASQNDFSRGLSDLVSSLNKTILNNLSLQNVNTLKPYKGTAKILAAFLREFCGT